MEVLKYCWMQETSNMQCNYNSFIQIINFHGLFRNALRCRKTGARRILVPLRYMCMSMACLDQNWRLSPWTIPASPFRNVIRNATGMCRMKRSLVTVWEICNNKNGTINNNIILCIFATCFFFSILFRIILTEAWLYLSYICYFHFIFNFLWPNAAIIVEFILSMYPWFFFKRRCVDWGWGGGWGWGVN